jgi:hypothetical protein
MASLPNSWRSSSARIVAQSRGGRTSRLALELIREVACGRRTAVITEVGADLQAQFEQSTL